MTITLETVFQIALRNCSQEAGGKVSIEVILVKGGKFNQAHIFCRRFLRVTKSSHLHEGA